MAIQDSSAADDNLTVRLIAEMNKVPILREAKPEPWDSDAPARLPNLAVKVISNELIPGQPVYKWDVTLSWIGKAKGAPLKALKKAIQNFVERVDLPTALTDSYITVGTYAEDKSYASNNSGSTREYLASFSLRGFRNQ